MKDEQKRNIYESFAFKENLPLFMQPYWLDVVCDESMDWDVILYKKGEEIWGSFVYVIKKKYGFTFITMPKLTQFLGPYIKYPKGQKYYNKLTWEKGIMNYFIDNLPEFDYFNLNFHHSIENWLPFYWKGFSQTTKYTYRISKNLNIKELFKSFETDIRRRKKKAERLGVKAYESNDVEKFYHLNKLTFERQGIKIPYSFKLVKRIYEKLKKMNAVKIFFAEHKGEIIAANFLVYDKNCVYYLMGGINPDKKNLGGMDVILYEAIKFALENGLDFDFEGSMIESIEKYFRGFGGKQVSYFYISKINSKILKIRNCLLDLLR